jgi:hypothetical protein
MLLLSLLVVLPNNKSSLVLSLLVQSEGSGAWATGLAWDETHQKVVVVGTILGDAIFEDTLISGNADTDCLVAIVDADDGSMNPKVFESPSLCVGGTVVPNRGVNEMALLVGLSGNQGTLQTIQGIASDPQYLSLGQHYDLPEQTMPVATTGGEELELFVALHNTNGHVFAKTNGGDKNNLQALLDYWTSVTVPSSTLGAPQIIKMDTTSGTIPFHITLTVHDGSSATIAAMHYTTEENSDRLVVVGSTNGDKDALGVNQERPSNDDDWDGYVAFFDDITGDLVDSTRIYSQVGKDDHVHDLCIYQSDLFIVGTTQGSMDDFDSSTAAGAFVMKIDMNSFSITWKHMIPGPTVEGLACVATQDRIYVAGHTEHSLEDGRPLTTQTVFVAALPHPPVLNVLWTQHLDTSLQVGDSRRNDLASMELTPLGGDGVVLLINSMNMNEGINNFFLVSLEKETGAHGLKETFEEMPEDESLGNDFGGGGSNSGSNNSNSPGSNKQSTQGDDKEQQKIAVILGILVPVVLAMSILGFQFYERRRYVEKVDLPPEDHELSMQKGGPGKEIV